MNGSEYVTEPVRNTVAASGSTANGRPIDVFFDSKKSLTSSDSTYSTKYLYEASLKFKGKSYPIPRYYLEKMEKMWPDASAGLSYRLSQEQIKAEADLLLDLNMMFGGRIWDELTTTEQRLASELLIDKSSDRP